MFNESSLDPSSSLFPNSSYQCHTPLKINVPLCPIVFESKSKDDLVTLAVLM